MTPSEPRNASVSFVNESSAVLTWLRPEITGTLTNVSYDIYCLTSCAYFDIDCEGQTCNSGIDRKLTSKGLNTTTFTATNLGSFVNYTCIITAKNRVSKMAEAATQTTDTKRTFTYVNLRTKGSGKLVESDIFVGPWLVPFIV